MPIKLYEAIMSKLAEFHASQVQLSERKKSSGDPKIAMEAMRLFESWKPRPSLMSRAPFLLERWNDEDRKEATVFHYAKDLETVLRGHKGDKNFLL